jgi:hypothetical protein
MMLCYCRRRLVGWCRYGEVATQEVSCPADSNIKFDTDVDGDSCAAVAAEFVLETTSIGRGAIAVHLLLSLALLNISAEASALAMVAWRCCKSEVRVEDIARKFLPLPNLATACTSDVMDVCGKQAENE